LGLTAAGVLNIIIALLLVTSLKHAGVAFASLLTEIVVTAATFLVVRKNGLDVFAADDKGVDNPEAAA
jgi:peptidoglycan biosynthesis protein MviN/MurJ (putative lipid II flippase)